MLEGGRRPVPPDLGQDVPRFWEMRKSARDCSIQELSGSSSTALLKQLSASFLVELGRRIIGEPWIYAGLCCHWIDSVLQPKLIQALLCCLLLGVSCKRVVQT